MEEITFTPDYGKGNIIATFFLSLVGIILLLSGYNANSTEIMVGGGFCFLVVVFAFVAYPRKIVFSQSQVTVKRYVLPDQVFEYQDFTDIGSMAIKFGRRGISVLNMKNGGELISKFQKLIEERKIQPSQMQGKLAVEEALTTKALKYALIPGVILGILANILLDTYFNIDINGRLVSGVVFLAVFLGIYFFLKNRQEMK